MINSVNDIPVSQEIRLRQIWKAMPDPRESFYVFFERSKTSLNVSAESKKIFENLIIDYEEASVINGSERRRDY